MTEQQTERPTRLEFTVAGRPAPQGSKLRGQHGQMREASAYMRPWRAAVKLAVYERYKALGIDPTSLPLLRGPVCFSATFWMPASVALDGPPDLDKLLRSTWDALTKARVWEDDGRVVEIGRVREIHGQHGWTGADIDVREVGE